MESDDAQMSGDQRSLPYFVAVGLIGDLALFFMFAALGRSSHGEGGGNSVARTMATAAPFAIGWIVCAVPLNAYTVDAFRSAKQASRRIIVVWPGACLIALGIRSGIEHRIAPLSFALVALIFNFATLTVWRVLLSIWWQRFQAGIRA
ncbi:MAG: hypothetical protein NVSMB52_09320 [Chloroflexota bacterium]